MNNYFKTSLFVLTIGCLAACKKDETSTPVQSQLLQDPDVSDSTLNWFFNYGYFNSTNPNHYSHAFSKDHYTSPPYALKISGSLVKDTSAFCNWGQVFIPPYMPVGTRLILKVKVRLENVAG